METKGYKERLRQLYHTHTKCDKGFAVVASRLQEDYPGNYRVTEAYDPEICYWAPKLVFETEQDEVWFKLRYE